MNAIRKIVKREGNTLTVTLPEDFIAENVELIILPFGDSIENSGIEYQENSDDHTLQMVRETFSKYHADLSNFKFDRDDLYDR